ncbi:transposase IS4 family protein [Caballeronia arvi]|uniref:Transposase IS4 family protein n=2 Tax=Caballeronia arvi TaxID=1777135 RepID=A0A158L6L3_9BURK|nr:transposase IS4 family protein [Caballeronia arvi]
MKRQIGFAKAEIAGKKRVTRRQRFLAEMEKAVPWQRLLSAIEPHYPKGTRGRPPMLFCAALAIAVLIALNLQNATRIAPYVIVGVVLWIFVLKSGVHATLAGVVIAFAVPLNATDTEGYAPLHKLEHGLHPWVAFAVLPIFAFANAGVSFAGVSLTALAEPLSLGIAAGLFVGKLIGVCGACAALVWFGMARLPEGADWLQMLGVAALCGVGFTMSLFIGSLAFEGPEYFTPLRLGVIAGSTLSGVTGYMLLRFASHSSGQRDRTGATDRSAPG